jgi:calcineurin-like phosphoesterase family protein
MSDTFITADEHYGHANMIRYCNRPFSDITEMQEAMIARHNAKVPNSQNYMTIHVGDMFWHTLSPAEAMAILSRLHGRHAYLLGNHEELIRQYAGVHGKFDWVRDVHMLRFNKRPIWLSHYAHQVWPHSHKGGWHLYGHSHGQLEGTQTGLKFDVGVDCHNFEPWSLEEVAATMSTKTSDHVITPDQVWPGKETQ